MTVYSFPSIVPNESEWELVSSTKVHRSPFNGSMQTIEMPGAYWAVSLTFRHLTDSQYRTLMAFLARLRGRAGRFYLHDHAHATPAGTATGTPLVNGASQTGNTLVTDGWTAGVTGILLAGDLIGYNAQLNMVAADVNSDGSGNASIPLVMPLRTSPANNDPITVSSPTAVFMLDQDSIAAHNAPGNAATGAFSSISFRAVEAYTTALDAATWS